MNLPLFELINYTLALILVFLFIRYLWIIFILREDQPLQWRDAVKRRQISRQLKNIRKGYGDEVRFFNWWIQIARLKNEQVPGVFVELGVYKGESARIIHAMDPERRFYLFDTFSGFPAIDLEVETGEAATYTPDHFADTNIDAVLKKIGGNHNIILCEGKFPTSASGFQEKVALVNMDADLYNPTKAGLDFFYPLLSPGGIIMVHDYNYKWPGIIQAVDEFVTSIPENMVLLPDINGTAMIIRNKF